jgi:hypothetical protein
MIKNSSIWGEEGVWKGWVHSDINNVYYFDDIGDKSFMNLWRTFINLANDFEPNIVINK